MEIATQRDENGGTRARQGEPAALARDCVARVPPGGGTDGTPVTVRVLPGWDASDDDAEWSLTVTVGKRLPVTIVIGSLTVVNGE